MGIFFKRYIIAVVQLLWIIIISIYLLISTKTASTNQFNIYIVINISLLIGFIGTWISTKKIFSIQIIFVSILYIFHHGMHIVDSLGINYTYLRDYDMRLFNMPFVYEAAVYSIISINIIQFAFLLFNQSNKRNYSNMRTHIDGHLLNFAIVVFLLTLIPTLYYDISRIIYLLSNSYGSGYQYGSNYLIVLSSEFFEISVIALIFSLRNRETWKRIYYAKIIWEIIKLFMIGNRMDPISSILSLIILKEIFISKSDKKAVIKYLVFGFLLVIISGLVSVLRQKQGVDLSNIVNILTKNNLLIRFFVESGTSLLTLVLTMRYGGSIIDYANGLTYVNSTLLLVPLSTFLFGNNLQDYISLGTVLNTHWGGFLGGSMLAELYYNFQWWGLLITFFVGVIISIFFNKLNKIDLSKNTLKATIMVYMVQILLVYPRDYFYSIMASLNISLYFIVSYYIYKIIIRGLKK